MQTQEWPLILFTILGQMAVGSFIVLGIAHYFANRKYGAEQADRLADRALLGIWPVLGLALLASLLHLGNPLNAPRAISNLATSWLSREILTSVLFFGLGVVFAFLQWRKLGSASLRNALAWLASLVGLVLVYAMSQVYSLAAQPAWNSLATPVSFFVTTFLLGSLAVGVGLVVNYAMVKRSDPDCAEMQCTLLRESVRWIAVAALVLLGVEVVTVAAQAIYLAGSGVPAAAQSAALTFNQFGALFVLRLALVFVGAGVFALALYRNALVAGREQALGSYVFAAFALVLAAEVMGRFLFYATHVRIGI